MAYDPIKPEDLKKLIKMAKNRPMNFAFNPGSKGDDLLILDKIQPAEKIARIAKKEGPEKKVAYGSFEIDGRVLLMTAEQTLPELAKKFVKHLKRLGFPLGVSIYDGEGNLIEDHLSDADDLDEGTDSELTVGQGAEAQIGGKDLSVDPAKRRAVLTEKLRALQTPIAELGTDGATFKKAISVVVGLLKQGDVDKAEKALERIEDGLGKAQDARSPVAGQRRASAEETSPDPKSLVARAGSLKTAIERLDENTANLVKPHLVQALASLKAQNYPAAEKQLSSAEDALHNASRREPISDSTVDVQENSEAEAKAAELDTEAVAKWEKQLGLLRADVDAAVVAGHGDLATINRAFGYATSLAEAGDFEKAGKAATATRRLLKDAAEAAENARVAMAEEAAPDNAGAWRKSRQEWINTRNGLYADLVRLQMAISAKAREIGGLEEVVQNTSVLVEYLDDLDSALEDTLNHLVEAPDGPERETLKKEAIRIIGSYRATLDEDFFRAVDQNGFTDTQIRGRALDALSGVETALAA